ARRRRSGRASVRPAEGPPACQRPGTRPLTASSSLCRPTTTLSSRRASRDRTFVLLLLPSKITVTGALHDCLRDGQSHVGAKTFRMEKICISVARQQES